MKVTCQEAEPPDRRCQPLAGPAVQVGSPDRGLSGLHSPSHQAGDDAGSDVA